MRSETAGREKGETRTPSVAEMGLYAFIDVYTHTGGHYSISEKASARKEQGHG